MKCANDNKIFVIRILQNDGHRNKFDWSNELITYIEYLKKNKKIENIFICKIMNMIYK